MNGTLILSVVFVYFLILVIISRLTGCRSGNAAFFSGDHQSPWYIVAIGMVGASLSGVSFVSVPGMVGEIDMTYMQTVLGFSLGYFIVAKVLLPVYYRLGLTSIYTFLKIRFGLYSYKSGALLFLISKSIGAAVRLYLVISILDKFVLVQWNIPFEITSLIVIALIWLYTHKSGIKTIVWTDMVQTVVMVTSLVAIWWIVSERMGVGIFDAVGMIAQSEHARIFVFDDFWSQSNFFKQFLSGCFITIVMSGLDQDMMQKNLSCKTLKESQKNIYSYGISFIPVNLIFLSIGVILLLFAQQKGIVLPANGDDILPMLATEGHLGTTIIVLFTIGIIAAAFSSADSALTALTTSVCIDFLNVERYPEAKATKIRRFTHVGVSAIVFIFMIAFRELNSRSVIDAIYVIAGYTYGPLLGLFVWGLFSKWGVKDKAVPWVCVASPLICFGIDTLLNELTGYKFGYELLIMNGLITALCLFMLRTNKIQTLNK